LCVSGEGLRMLEADAKIINSGALFFMEGSR
jgi:hypothetical protein